MGRGKRHIQNFEAVKAEPAQSDVHVAGELADAWRLADVRPALGKIAVTPDYDNPQTSYTDLYDPGL